MLYGNVMEVALLNAGLITRKRKPRIPKVKTFACRKCHGTLETHPLTNIAACDNPECGNFIIFI
jgi:hypothetical protein